MFGLRRLLAEAGLLMAGGLFLIVAGLLFGVAGWLFLSDLLGPVLASLSVAGAFLLTALILFALARPRRPRQAPARPAASREDTLRSVFAEAGLRVPEKGESPPLAEAFVLGVALALRLKRDLGR